MMSETSVPAGSVLTVVREKSFWLLWKSLQREKRRYRGCFIARQLQQLRREVVFRGEQRVLHIYSRVERIWKWLDMEMRSGVKDD